MEKNCQQHWTKLNRNLLPVFCLFVASIAHAHPAWLHKVVDGELASGIILEVDYTTGILKIALTQISGQPKQEILRFTNETKFAGLVPANLDDILEFTFVKLEGKSADDRRAFLADTLTILPDWSRRNLDSARSRTCSWPWGNRTVSGSSTRQCVLTRYSGNKP